MRLNDYKDTLKVQIVICYRIPDSDFSVSNYFQILCQNVIYILKYNNINRSII